MASGRHTGSRWSLVDIQRIDPADEAQLVEIVDFLAAREAVDCPWRDGTTIEALRVFLRQGWDGDPDIPYAARVDGRLVAYGDCHLPTRDNVDTGWWTVTVAPDQRRRGYGSALASHLEALLAEAGRTKLGSWCMDAPANVAFLTGRGYAAKSVHVIRRQVLAEVDPAGIDAAYEAALTHAGDYELLRIKGLIPDELLEDAVTMVAAINDAPRDDLDVEDEVIDADRLRTYEQGQLDAGQRLYRVIARHRETGELAGHTVVTVDSTRPTLGDQHDTSVLQAHRGHRLGLLLKSDMLRWLREAEPQLVHITTGNAETNAQMIAVNERLGYRVIERNVTFQRLPEAPPA